MLKRGAGGGGAADISAIIWLAAAVPSAWQLGHCTAQGIRPSRGSTSKE